MITFAILVAAQGTSSRRTAVLIFIAVLVNSVEYSVATPISPCQMQLAHSHNDDSTRPITPLGPDVQ